ncbi:E3 ubiquitin ligase [Stygiomarasmius scandens]|uniref:E3 ubiquitin ligase n=1 Tax=Marasmiellus scandens TaxID=2682957 RepID=A0ABR1J0U2_9AGAR
MKDSASDSLMDHSTPPNNSPRFNRSPILDEEDEITRIYRAKISQLEQERARERQLKLSTEKLVTTYLENLTRKEEMVKELSIRSRNWFKERSNHRAELQRAEERVRNRRKVLNSAKKALVKVSKRAQQRKECICRLTACGLCLRTMVRPMMLECGHLFDEACLYHRFLTYTASSNPIWCPKCELDLSKAPIECHALKEIADDWNRVWPQHAALTHPPNHVERYDLTQFFKPPAV